MIFHPRIAQMMRIFFVILTFSFFSFLVILTFTFLSFWLSLFLSF